MNKHSVLVAALLVPALLVVGGTALLADSSPVRVTVKDGKVKNFELVLPADPNPHIAIGLSPPNVVFGLSVDGRRLCCSPQGSIWQSIRVDGKIMMAGFGQPVQAQWKDLPPGPFGRPRNGKQATWVAFNQIHVTQSMEIIPSKAAPGQKRQLDNCRIIYLLENKDSQPHKVDFRTSIDIMINNNDGALYAAPVTHPGKILNGIELKDKEFPPYLHVLERPDLNSPGMIGVMTFKQNKGEGPNRAILANLGVVFQGQQVWDIIPQPAGDSACAIYWDGRDLKPGQKRELVWSYGGGIASDPENEGKVSLDLGGSFEPKKMFTVVATVEDPVPSQVLRLELPPGMERIDGREVQPVALPGPEGTSIVQWKARVVRPGDYEIKVHSSTGSIQSKQVTIEAAR